MKRAEEVMAIHRVNVDRTFELDEIRVAHRYMEASHAVGKLVVLITPAVSRHSRPGGG